jgi:opacity protein-like surface antigen
VNTVFLLGSTLAAGTLSPASATATYQWQRSEDGSVFGNIPGAVFSAYEIQPEDAGCYLRVVATGSGAYLGPVTSTAIGPVE